MIIEFLLFGVIEVFILLMFYKYIGNIDKVKMWHGIWLCLLFFLVGLIQFPFIKQIGMIVIFIIYIKIIDRTIKVIKTIITSIESLFYLLCVEAIYCVASELIFKIDITSLQGFDKFIFMLPIRFIEISIILAYKKSTE